MAFSVHDGGSIKAAPVSNMSNYRVMLEEGGVALNDIQIFSKRRQMGTNPCSRNNGGCEQLCLFNGTHPICTCSYGHVAPDGQSCGSKKLNINC